jgi:glycosyltransferase involved in cell wall biosynthesis
MLRLAADGELRKRMGAQARREAQKFSKEEFCKNFYNSIASIVSQENAQCKKC